MAKAISEQPGLGEIPICLLVQIVPSLIETIERNKASQRGRSSVEGDVGTSETGILSDSMADSESASSSDMGVPAMGIPPVQLPLSSSPIAQPEQSPLIAQFQSVPGTSNNATESSMGISAAVPIIHFPDWYPTVPEEQLAPPTYTHLEGPLSTVPSSQGSSIESGSGAGEARTDSEGIDRFVDDLDWSLEDYVNFECL
jgi:hypothetical protein